MGTTIPIQTISTSPFMDQRPGTSGLRKKTKEFQRSHYLENFVQSVLNVLSTSEKCIFPRETLVLGGDGRFFNLPAIQKIIKMAIANNIGKILVGKGGWLSTPAMSVIIRQYQAMGGFLLTASHNPGGPNEDFGIKFNSRNGGPAPEFLTEQIFKETQSLRQYHLADLPDVQLDILGVSHIGTTKITVIDPVRDYTALMEQLFDFDRLRAFFTSGKSVRFDAMHGITGPYATHIFNQCLGAPEGTVIRATPLEDFGGIHPDPNLVHAGSLLKEMAQPIAPDLGAACDGDGDRNLIAGKNMFVSPGDSLAIIAHFAKSSIPGYRQGLQGVARSMPTSTAIDRVAKALKIPCYETPTGWKYFGNLMDAGRCTLCGEESFGTGSNHIREKDGLWAVLAWISILASTDLSIREITHNHWTQYGRSYFQRHDFDALNTENALAMLSAFESQFTNLIGKPFADSVIQQVENFCYTDPVDGAISNNQGICMLLENGSRLVTRLSGTGTEGATLRLYGECIRTADLNESADSILNPYIKGAIKILEMERYCNRNEASLVT